MPFLSSRVLEPFFSSHLPLLLCPTSRPNFQPIYMFYYPSQLFYFQNLKVFIENPLYPSKLKIPSLALLLSSLLTSALPPPVFGISTCSLHPPPPVTFRTLSCVNGSVCSWLCFPVYLAWTYSSLISTVVSSDFPFFCSP